MDRDYWVCSQEGKLRPPTSNQPRELFEAYLDYLRDPLYSDRPARPGGIHWFKDGSSLPAGATRSS